MFKIVIQIFIWALAFQASSAALAQNDAGSLTDWSGHGVQMLTPTTLIMSEQTADEIVFADAASSFYFSCMEVDHSDYGCAGTVEIERRLRQALINSGGDGSKGFAQSRQTEWFRIRSMMAPSVNNPGTLIYTACLIGDKHTYVALFRAPLNDIGLIDDILASFVEK